MRTYFWLTFLLLLLLSYSAEADALYVWGDNSSGEYGNGTTTSSLTPLANVLMTSGVTAIGGTQASSLAVKNGATYSWGSNVWGNVGNGGVTPSTVLTPYAIPSLSTGVIALTGAYYSSGVIKNGAVYCWGNNTYDAVGDGTTTNRYTPTATQVLTSGVTAIAIAGNGTADHGLAVKGGAVYSWGYANDFGDAGTGSNAPIATPVQLASLSSGATAVAANQVNGAAITNGKLYAWGFNNFGTVGNGTYTEQDTPVPVSSMSSGVTAVALGNSFMLMLQNGAVYGSGNNSTGGLGNSTTSTTNVPIQILPASDSIVAISAGLGSGYALSSDGSIWDWGYNASGQLGNGNTNEVTTPEQIFAPSGDRFTAVDAEYNSVLALVTPVPEPSTLIPTLIILAGMITLCRRPKKPVPTADCQQF